MANHREKIGKYSSVHERKTVLILPGIVRCSVMNLLMKTSCVLKREKKWLCWRNVMMGGSSAPLLAPICLERFLGTMSKEWWVAFCLWSYSKVSCRLYNRRMAHSGQNLSMRRDHLVSRTKKRIAELAHVRMFAWPVNNRLKGEVHSKMTIPFFID